MLGYIHNPTQQHAWKSYTRVYKSEEERCTITIKARRSKVGGKIKCCHLEKSDECLALKGLSQLRPKAADACVARETG